jgi:hypothetical protein
LLELDEDSSLRRFPLRTQLLMLVALAAFIRLWCVTHPAARQPSPESPRPVDVTVQTLHPDDRAAPPDAG